MVTTLQCGGNRRNEMNSVEITNGAPWRIGAISTGKFSGFLCTSLLIIFIIVYSLM